MSNQSTIPTVGGSVLPTSPMRRTATAGNAMSHRFNGTPAWGTPDALIKSQGFQFKLPHRERQQDSKTNSSPVFETQKTGNV
jgi:hypothetical protein